MRAIGSDGSVDGGRETLPALHCHSLQANVLRLQRLLAVFGSLKDLFGRIDDGILWEKRRNMVANGLFEQSVKKGNEIKTLIISIGDRS